MQKTIRRKRFSGIQLTSKQKNDIVAKWVGTPYGHRMCRPGRGVDCVHLAAAILSELGIDIPIPGYQRLWRINDPSFFERELERLAPRWRRIAPSNTRFGDIGLVVSAPIRKVSTKEIDEFEPERFIQHCFIIVDKARIIHILDDSLPQVRIEDRQQFEYLVNKQGGRIDKYIRFDY